MRAHSVPEIPGLLVLEPTIYEDERGYFFESYNEKVFRELGIAEKFVQDNHSRSRRFVIRGLHYQICHPQAKLVRVVVGEIFDVAVDIRKSSPTFGRWFGIRLSADNKKQVYIPAGFAHGFLVLSDWAEVLYKTTDFYHPECDRTIIWNDPDIGISWPLDGKKPIISAKDARGKTLAEAEVFE
ncbi:dTDP-4-dehydrorhamnose 3,5-epimerase [Thermodesulforhabdus norvegica]|uniref:dTDP-4-dehydrorhamnose 3,5-epimerase n=1 Tax=Thermodesulforhabdus norvegica TaxID=39841 RepID=A0A1I4UP23_9BACT|nr:dTDP-4-dehydrorhamnose 3,5-epimerase [Thermodesulforhabdus norvegica]SFM90757.1 dTDP-4-dehydrorhamnose 3,5-epimerase [Thermodesulforhabdus norvegica]